MRHTSIFAFVVGMILLGAIHPVAADTTPTGGLSPWHFQMTPEEVRSFKDWGPYEPVGKDSDSLATFSGIFNGSLEYVELDFTDGRLARIGIFLYYGTDISRASEVWGRSFTTLKSMYGEVKMPRNRMYGSDASTATEASIATGGLKIVQAGGKTHLVPATQPADAFVVSTFRSVERDGRTTYFVILYYEPPRKDIADLPEAP